MPDYHELCDVYAGTDSDGDSGVEVSLKVSRPRNPVAPKLKKISSALLANEGIPRRDSNGAISNCVKTPVADGDDIASPLTAGCSVLDDSVRWVYCRR